ncbi:hypothetical protein EDB80DRAFT_882584 [Ilyonectria destructans]|nr:hypothetical protein EDB80DRAFT_882584 [Ilyonectria destructans]
MTTNASQDFSSKYTNANLAPDATPYDSYTLCNIVKELQSADHGSISSIAPALVAAMLCAQRRGDAVPKLFHDLSKEKNKEEIKAMFLSLKHAINITWPFVGLPNCIPASLGLVNELREYGITVSSEVNRPLLNQADWLSKGHETSRAIYRAVGNSEVAQMMADYFPETSHVANAAVFGFLIGGSDQVQSLKLSEIIIAGTICAMGATRQAKSHFKGSIGLGISAAAVERVSKVAEQVAAWNGVKLPGEIDVSALAEEVRINLERLEKS